MTQKISYMHEQGYRIPTFPAELEIMEAEAAGDPIGHGPAMLAYGACHDPASAWWRRRAKDALVAALVAAFGWLLIAVIVLVGAVLAYGIAG